MAPSLLHAIEGAVDALRGRRPTRIIGLESGVRGLLLARAMRDPDAEGPVVVVVADDRSARETAADVAFFAGSRRADRGGDVEGPILVVPELETSPFADASPDPRNVSLRMAALARLRSRDDVPELIVVSLRSLLRKCIAPEAFEAHGHRWVAGSEAPRDEAIAALVDAGYRRVDVVEDPATFSVRGHVMDVFVPRRRFPARVEWWGDDIERIRLFDPDTQRSLREVEAVEVHPVRETIRTTSADLRLRVLELADALEVPTSTSRQVVENLRAGLDFFGIEALAPLFHDGLVSLAAHLPAGARWFVDEPEGLLGLAERVLEDYAAQHGRARAAKSLVSAPEDFFVGLDELRERFTGVPLTGERMEVRAEAGAPGGARRRTIRVALDSNLALRSRLEAARGERGGELLRPVVEEVRELERASDPDEGGAAAKDPLPWDVVLVAPNLTHAGRLVSMLRGYGLELDDPAQHEGRPLALGLADEAGAHRLRLRVVAGQLSQGFRSDADRVMVVGEAEIFGRVVRKHRSTRKRLGVASLSQLTVGDHVVHVMHGIGRYEGLVKLELGGVPGDYVHVEYAGKDRLYLPVYRISEIERYSGADGSGDGGAPRLDRLGGQTFATKTARVKADVRQLAEELLQIYAQREAQSGHAYPEGGDMYAQFEQTFPFEETPDQLAAIEAVQADLGDPRPMDRLVCGDVGFGKTEVALRAAFRAAAAGKQVAVLAPTTVLVQQHYLTFADRMGAFPLEVGCLNRFQSAADRRRTLAAIRSGELDVVVGTHRLLSRDVRFDDLGLVIIDEEQRFGVAQKERFKKLKTKVDVLTLTATPIPRTLHMSLLGLREISLISTPPVDRLAVRTHIARAGDQVIEAGVRAELARGGQVFFVVPRVLGIEEHALRIRELVPEARVMVAHGQMPPEQLEQAMVDFVEHRADVLVSTTIIESGLDIPRANTMFVHRAEMFGMAQLYQLRGRIGRSKLRAYCYLLVNSLEKLAPEARRRLEGVQRNSELGSGFNVASSDLEIRGAGDILGKRQSGSIQAIGFEAYARILSEAVAELRGDPVTSETDPELAFDLPAFLPDDYVEDVGQRLDLYRRLSTAVDPEAVREVVAELEDRYGEAPLEARCFGLMMTCKTHGRRLRAVALELRSARLVVRLGPESRVDGAAAASLSRRSGGRIRLGGPDRVVCELGPAGEAGPLERLRAATDALVELRALVDAD